MMVPLLTASLVIWTFEYAVYESVAQTMGLSIPFLMLCLVIGFSNLFSALIPSPAGVGAFEASVIWLLVALDGRAFSESSSFAIIVHAVLIVPVTLAGTLSFIVGVIRRQMCRPTGVNG